MLPAGAWIKGIANPSTCRCKSYIPDQVTSALETPTHTNTHQYATFLPSLTAGKLNEDVIFHEFEYQGLPLIRPPEGKHPFDAYLPDGRAVEMKIDFRSQCTGRLALEWPTLQRGADIYILTTTTARVFTHRQVEQMYMRGKIPAGGFGEQGYDGRYVSLTEYYNGGQRLYEFINSLEQAVP